MKVKFNLWPLGPFITLIFALEFASRSQWIPAYLAPAPSEVWAAITTDSHDLWNALFQTARGALIGFSISVFFGLALGLIFSSHSIIRRSLYPYATFFQTVPIIAIAPLLVIWFGYGLPTVVASTAIVSIFPVIASTLSGMQSTDRALLDLFKIYRASKLQTVFKLQLPFALPQIFVGLKIASGLAVIGAIVGEFIAGGGLGGLIDVARTRQKLDQLFAAVILASLLGLLLLSLIDIVSRLSLRNWHASEKES